MYKRQVYNETVEGEDWTPNGVTAGESAFVTYINGHSRVRGNNQLDDKNGGQLGIDTVNDADGNAYYPDVKDNAVVLLHAGDSDPDHHYEPFNGAKSIAAAANGANGVIFDSIGKIYAWGDNTRGQIGDGTQDNREYPAAVLIDGGGAYIDFAEATLTRNDISDIPIHMFYDTIMRDNGTLETAVRQNDVIQIDLDNVVGVIGFTLFGESAYKPTGLTFESLNTEVAEFEANPNGGNNTTGKLYIKQKTGVTYLVAKDSRGNTGTIKLNVIPAGNDRSNVMPMIAVGENHTIALRSDGTVWSWGNNSYGQSGNGSKSSYTTIPVQVLKRENATASPSALTNVIKIATGGNHSLALTSDGHVYAWGTGVKGALGNGSQTEFNVQKYAVRVYGTTRSYYLGDSAEGTVTESIYGSRIIDIAAAGTGSDSKEGTKQYSYAIDADGNIFGWGYNYKGVVSPQDTYNAKMTLPRNITTRNTILKSARKLIPDKLGDTMHVLKADGQIITWGDNSNGIYGIGENISTSPSRASLPEKAIAAFGGTNNIMAILMDGGVAMWGDLRQGQLGYGSDSPEYLTVEKTPVRAYNFELAQRGAFPLSGDISEYVQVIYANGGQNDDGSYSSENLWSAGMYGAMLGRGTEHDNEILPVGRVFAGKTDVSGYVKNVILVSNGRTNSDISVITTDNGAVWAYGINENGIIGDGTTVDRYEPARVGTAYFLFDKYTYSLRVDDVEEPKRPTISSFNLLSGAEGTSTEEVELKWQTWDGSSDIVEVDSSTGKLTGKKLSLIHI